VPTKIDKEVKEIALRMYLNGESNLTIASKCGIHLTTVSNIARAAGVIRSKAEGQAVRSAREAVGFDRFGKKGAVQSVKSGKWYASDSAYEFVRMHQLDSDSTVREWSRCQDRIPYQFGDKTRFYVPDLRVVAADGAITIEEIKPNKLVATEKNIAKFAAAKAHYASLGVAFQVVTEDQIGWFEIRRYDGVALHGVPDEERMQKRRDASMKVLNNMSHEKRAAYNLAAKIREAAKRSIDRDAYNAKAREYRAKRKAKKSPQANLF
jgi:hypothetical protein